MKELQKLYASYYQDLYDWFYYRCGNKHLAEDLTQDTFVQVIRSIASFQGKSSERTWMLGIARHVWLSHLRIQKPTVELQDQVSSKPQEEATLYKQVLEQIKQRDERAYSVFILRMEGYSCEEIAQQLHCTSTSVRVLFHRSKLWIQKEWEEDK